MSPSMRNSSNSSIHATSRLPFRRSACVVALTALCAVPAQANPAGASVIAGQASIIQQGNQTTITNSNGAVIHWQSFSIGRDEITRFVQPSAASSVLNRVIGPEASTLLGRLQSNGRVFLINPAGIMIGAGARIDVAAFVASSLNLRNEDFLANRLNFQATPGAGLVRNEGIINTPQGGQVYLVAPRVENAGVIDVPGGEVVLAAGRTVQIGDTAAPGVRIEVAGGESARNVGSVIAAAGRIGMFGALVKNSGSLNASSAVSEGGRILLKASGDTIVEGAATLTAAGARGGRVEILGERVALADRASVDVSGREGGGTVLVGGDYQGANPAIQNAQVVWIGPQTSIRADATENGAGGQVVLWSDHTTRAYGDISARGGAIAGDGGRIETSGRRYLDVEGIRVNASAANGRAGGWLLDPEEIRIVNGAPVIDSNLTGGPVNFAPAVSSSPALISDATINAAINTNSTVTLATGSAGSGTGDITFDAASGPILIGKTGNTFNSVLNINAYRNVIFSGGSTTFRTSAGAGSATLGVNLNAGTLNSVGAANVFTDAGASVNLDATSSAQVTVAVGNGKTWNNNGTVNLIGKATLSLPTQLNRFPAPVSTPATFLNNGTFNNASSAPWFILSNPANQDGRFDNFGTVNTVGGSVEGIFNNNPGATLNLLGANLLSLQNAQLMRGNINIPNASAELRISEYHGVVARFHDTAMSGQGRVNVAGGDADFQRVSGGNVSLEAGAGGSVTVTNGLSTFGDVLPIAGSLSITGGALGVAGNFNVPTGITASGSVGLAAGGNLVLPAGFSIAGATSIKLGAGGNIEAQSPNLTSAGPIEILAGGSLKMIGGVIASTNDALNVVIKGDVVLDAFAGPAALGAKGPVNLALLSPGSRIELIGAPAGAARISSSSTGSINIDFRARSAGGVVVDGARSLGPGSFGSGFRIGTQAAVRGGNLFIKYGVVDSDICKTLPGLCIVRPPTPIVVREQNKARQDKDDEEGFGAFGDSSPGASGTRKRPGVCKAA